jgi:hypothetical protein
VGYDTVLAWAVPRGTLAPLFNIPAPGSHWFQCLDFATRFLCTNQIKRADAYTFEKQTGASVSLRQRLLESQLLSFICCTWVGPMLEYMPTHFRLWDMTYSECTGMAPVPDCRPTHLSIWCTQGVHFQPTGGPLPREDKKMHVGVLHEQPPFDDAIVCFTLKCTGMGF